MIEAEYLYDQLIFDEDNVPINDEEICVKRYAEVWFYYEKYR